MFSLYFFNIMSLFFLTSFKDIKPILITFFGTIGLLIVFMGVAYLAKFISDKLHNKKVDNSQVKAKIYQLIYENKNLTKEDIIKYIDLKEEVVDPLLIELMNDGVINLVDGSYSINKKENKEEKVGETTEEKQDNNEKID